MVPWYGLPINLYIPTELYNLGLGKENGVKEECLCQPPIGLGSLVEEVSSPESRTK
jgi:hypothetical protein